MLIKRINLIKLNSIIDKIKTKTFDIYTQYNFLKLQEYIKKETEIYIEQQAILIEKYGARDNDGKIIMKQDNSIKLNPEFISLCEESLKQIENLQIQIPDIYFSLDELKNLELTFEELYLLEPFIKK